MTSDDHHQRAPPDRRVPWFAGDDDLTRPNAANEAETRSKPRLSPRIRVPAQYRNLTDLGARVNAEPAREENRRVALFADDRHSDTDPPIASDWDGADAKPGGFFRSLGRLAYLGLLTSLWVIGAGVIFVVYSTLTLPDPSAALQIRGQKLIFLDQSGDVIAEKGDRPAEPIKVKELPPFVVDAVLAAEDHRFYDHPGFDAYGLGRAAFTNLLAGRVKQGGSTITQQLAKNLYLTRERTLSRKHQEFFLALWLESHLSKDEILGLYLSRVYFGAGATGLDSAAHRYFRKTPRELSLPEAALLAGLLRAPSRDGPLSDVARAKTRTEAVLFSMAKRGKVSNEQWITALQTPVRVQARSTQPIGAWATDLAERELKGLHLPDDAEIRVRLTLNRDWQDAAENAVANQFAHLPPALAKLGPAPLQPGEKAGVSPRADDLQVALVAMDDHGAIRALIGGRDYQSSPFNRAIDAKRQPGSAFKPFLFAAALDYGLRPSQAIPDVPFQYDGWTPKNYDDQYSVETTLANAFAKSLNAPAAFIANQIGMDRVLATAKRFGVVTSLPAQPAIALGAGEVGITELVAAYGPFMTKGRRIYPHIIQSYQVGDQAVQTLPAGTSVLPTPAPEPVTAPPPAANIDPLTGTQTDAASTPANPQAVGDNQPVASARTIAIMRDLLALAVRDGTGKPAAIPGRVVRGKTGTTNDSRDGWFVGFSGPLLAGVWVGRDSNSPVPGLTGGSLPAQIWRGFAEVALRGVAPDAAEAQWVEPATDPNETAAITAFGDGDNPDRDLQATNGFGGNPADPSASGPNVQGPSALGPSPNDSRPAPPSAGPGGEEDSLADLEGFIAEAVRKQAPRQSTAPGTKPAAKPGQPTRP